MVRGGDEVEKRGGALREKLMKWQFCKRIYIGKEKRKMRENRN